MIQDLTRDDMICKGRRCMFLFAVYMAIYLLIYGFLLLRLAPLWDEVYDYCGEGMDSYVIFRRWGQFLYRIVFAEGLQPYIAGIVAGIYICLAILLQTAYFRFSNLWQGLAYGAVYLCSIHWAYQVIFSEQCDAVALGILCVTAAAYLFSCRKGAVSILAPALLVGFGASIYQMLLLYFVALVAARTALCREPNAKGIGRIACKGLVVTVAGLVFYMAVAKIVEACWTLSIPNEEHFRSYQASLSTWSQIMEVNGLALMARSLMHWELVELRHMWICLTGSLYNGQWVYVGTFIPLVGLCILRRPFNGWHSLLHVLFLLLPFLCYPLLLFKNSGGALAARMMVVEPVVMGFMWVAFLEKLKTVVSLKRWLAVMSVFGAAVCFALLKGSYRVSQMAKDEIHTQELGFAQIREMGTRGRILAEQAGMQECRIMVLCPSSSNFDSSRTRLYAGPIKLNRQSDSVIYAKGAFEIMYADYAGESSIFMGTEEDYTRHREELETMPYWPAPGSMRACGDCIIVKVQTK